VPAVRRWALPPRISFSLSLSSRFDSKGKLAIVNPPRRVGCAALMPEYSFMLEQHQEVEICSLGQT